jgi:preprotein translocase subunit SecY
MFDVLKDKKLPILKNQSGPNRKILLTLIILLLFRFGNTIPLSGIDQEALKQSFLQLENKNAIMQIINMYSGSGGTKALVTPFSLGIIPFINASILIDLLTAIIPSLEKLQQEEGEIGRRKILFYKKILTLIFAVAQSVFLIFYLKSYFYDSGIMNNIITSLQLVSGAMLVVWLSNIIDNKGIGNGTSIIIFTNIVVTLIGKNLLTYQLDSSFIIQILFLLFLIILICISQTARINIDVVSARQLAFLENIEKNDINDKLTNDFQIKENGLAIKLNQAGIFPIIIAANIYPIFTFISDSILGKGNNLPIINSVLYYLLIIGFNYFYTIVFWDPEKISEQLRKASVSVVNITPGKETISYLENVVKSTSIIGGIFLCVILILYESFKQIIGGALLNQINISSLIILVGVAYEVQKTIRALYKNQVDLQTNY